jgi:hypothetical protein
LDKKVWSAGRLVARLLVVKRHLMHNLDNRGEKENKSLVPRLVPQLFVEERHLVNNLNK